MIEINAVCPDLHNGLSHLIQNMTYIVRLFVTAMNTESLLYYEERKTNKMQQLDVYY